MHTGAVQEAHQDQLVSPSFSPTCASVTSHLQRLLICEHTHKQAVSCSQAYSGQLVCQLIVIPVHVCLKISSLCTGVVALVASGIHQLKKEN